MCLAASIGKVKNGPWAIIREWDIQTDSDGCAGGTSFKAEGEKSFLYPAGCISLSAFRRKSRTRSRASREGRPATPCSLHEPIKVL
jgi:hypothetical protein